MQRLVGSALGFAASLVFILGVAAPSAPARAPTDPDTPSEPSTAVCVEQMELAFAAPGLDMSRVRKTAITTNGETGRIACLGTIDGQPVTGPGTIGLDGIAHGTCVNGEIEGTLTMTVPTAGGQRHLQVPATIGWQAAVGLSSSPPGRNGLVQLVPTAGDCLNTAATKALLVDEDVFTS